MNSRKFLSHSAFSLIEILVVTGIISIILATLMSVTQNSQKLITGITSQHDSQDLRALTNTLLSKESLCKHNLENLDFDLNFTEGLTPEKNQLSQIISNQTSNSKLIELNNKWGNLKIQKIWYEKYTEPEFNGSQGSLIGYLFIQLDRMPGQSTNHRQIKIPVKFEIEEYTDSNQVKKNRIKTCTSTADFSNELEYFCSSIDGTLDTNVNPPKCSIAKAVCEKNGNEWDDILNICIDKNFHSADFNKDYQIDCIEFNHILKIFTQNQNHEFHCNQSAASGYESLPENQTPNHSCPFHSADINKDWKFSLSEILRVIQYWNVGGGRYRKAFEGETSEDGFKPVTIPAKSINEEQLYGVCPIEFLEGYPGMAGVGVSLSKYNYKFDKIFHDADINNDYKIDCEELNIVKSMYNSNGYHCDENSHYGYATGLDASKNNCRFHSADYDKNWKISLSEWLRMTQLYNIGRYERHSPGTAPLPQEDGFHAVATSSNLFPPTICP